jgi:hypothetical protein
MRRLADDDDTAVAFQQAPIALSHHRMIVYEQYADLTLIALSHADSHLPENAIQT